MPETVGVCGNWAIFSWCALISCELVNKGQSDVNNDKNDPSVLLQVCKFFTLSVFYVILFGMYRCTRVCTIVCTRVCTRGCTRGCTR